MRRPPAPAVAPTAALVAALALAGCTVGPNYRAPQMPAPARFGEVTPDRAATPAPPMTAWWRAFGDAELERLIAIALAESPDVATATARIAAARAQERAARAAYLPEVNAQAGVNSLKFSKNAGLSSLSSLFGGGEAGGAGGTGGGAAGGTGGGTGSGIALPGNSVTTFSVGFDASWEIDLFGGVARQNQAARARTQAAIWNARDAQLSLIGDIADAYLQLRTLQTRETIARAEVDRQSRNLKLMAETAKSGLVPEGDYVRQRAQLANAEAVVGPIVAEGKAEMHALGVLLGRTPDSLIAELAVPRPQLAPPPEIPPGLPADLLRRRPDIRAAERSLAAATADIGVAVADLFPRLTLTGMAQLISTALGNLFSGDSLQLTGNAGAMFPVLDFGRRSSTVTARRAQADEAYQDYRRTVLSALRDVEDALIRIHTEQQRQAALKRGVTDAARAVHAVEARYESGLVPFGDVLEARQSVLSGQDQLAQSDGQLRRDLLSFYKALGGGWEDLPLAETKAGAASPAYVAPRGTPLVPGEAGD
ncbi:efflux transporter outer membrane subunit [Sphingomonas profundi]|uniref:efflux transporter outer membrane subunit n=1 Tax=Alterirhizorhabdus profundi TaxID=2681549 RepID=UPI0012E8DD20|nr:efflux transporter outer membrane subunit [Sphingomonas profundi]